MRFVALLFLAGILVSCKKEIVKKVSMKEDVTILADDTFNGRETGTEGELQAAKYILGRFKEIGLLPKGSQGSFTQTFTFRPSLNPHEEAEFTGMKTDSTLTGTNVVGYIDNNAETTVVIGAHYDHLGMGGEGSLYREGEAIHNGADDNASGVAVMLYLASRLVKVDSVNTKNNYLFIAFSGEEMGLLGSNYFVKNPTIDTKKVSYMINMDMVGRLNNERTLAVHGVGTSPIFKQTLFANNKVDLNIAEHESGVGPSDHTSFYLADIPVLHFFTGQHEDYHKPGDDAEKLNYKGMETIGNYIYSIISDLDDNGKIAFRKTKNESEAVPDFKVTLGVVPDYLYTGEGMRIDGVSEDRPAQKAGLQKGDVVLQLGEHETKSMMKYMKALSRFEEGQNTTAIINRNGEVMEVAITF
ncbi:M28 family peptidase [Cochleicola gelatinilyticus]|uniref:Peptidase M28 n=1 Tax=Cochleicola gelatinilyticus TaxID=1763537 RepID=A0A167JF79_9FLAO|nr:M28 family peptidase [Cochleicola gelatinilyticus]OAB80616.1 peptidase M28 [Cochleicola gelatinilyticus]